MYKFLITMLLFISLLSCFAENEMPIMYTFQGPWEGSYYGEFVISLDFNADNIDDLLIYNAGEENLYNGVIDIHFGGNEFGIVPDLQLEGTFLGEHGKGLYAVNDVNGDGYEDFATLSPSANIDNAYTYNFYYGGPNPDLLVDQQCSYYVGQSAGYDWSYPKMISCLGDVNGDGCDEQGLILQRIGPEASIGLLVGGSFEILEVIPAGLIFSCIDIDPLGDLNNDGYDDFSIGYWIYPEYSYTYVYWGNPDFDFNQHDSIAIYNHSSISYHFSGSLGIGDFNNDGYDDFIYPRQDNFSNNGYGLKLMTNDLHQAQGFPLQRPSYHPCYIYDDGYNGHYIKHGDFNGDGYSDIVGANPSAYLNDGIAGVWLGGQVPNGTCDLTLNEVSQQADQFGYSLAVGDFDNDGYDDIAISEPFMVSGWDQFGFVTIFSGSDQLTDTKVANDDTEEVIKDSLKLNLYPNPVKSNNLQLNFEIKGDIPKNCLTSKMDIYNLKGQKVQSNDINIVSKSGTVELNSIASGMYLAKIKINDEIISAKFIVK